MAGSDKTYILIADDHELHEALKGSFFRRAGFVIHSARAGDDILATVSELRPVLVILTLDMPGGNGDVICRQIKEDPELRSTPVALVAHYEDEDERERCHEAGCDEILRRPLGVKQILAASYRMLKVVVDRFEYRAVVQVDGKCGSDSESLKECSILNLSSGGAFIETGKLRPVDSSVLLEFVLPGDGQVVRCSGRVAWLNHPEWSRKPQLPVGFGVQFDDVPAQLGSEIEDFIHSMQ
jgi:CheY-like chemotaxis protein/Tfp pilus assembly protein PilZ